MHNKGTKGKNLTSDSDETLTLMGPSEVAKYLGMTERTIYMWAQQGKIPAFKVGSVWRFRRNDVDKWLESTRSGPEVEQIEPLTPYIEPKKSKWRIRKDEEEADKAIIQACRAYIETTLRSVGRENFTVEQFEGRFGTDVVKTVIEALKKEKIISEGEHEGLNGEKVPIIRKRS